MPRKKKVVDENFIDLFSQPVEEEKWDTVCPLCGKKFLKTVNHCYFVDGKTICSWRCFFDNVTKWEIERIKLKEVQPQRGRKPKKVEEAENDENVL